MTKKPITNEPKPPKASSTPAKTGSIFGNTPPPAPPVKTSGSKESQFISWAMKNKLNRKTAGDIWYWASKYGSNVGSESFAYYWSAVILRESGGKNAADSGQATGVGQIAYSWVGGKIPWRKDGKRFTNDDDPQTGIKNYGVNIRFSAQLLSSAVSTYGYDGAYLKGYNPNDPNKGAAWSDIQTTLKSAPKGLVLAPSQGPGTSTPAPGDNSIAPFKDPFVTGINKQGKFSTTNDPNKAMQFDGRPLTRSTFLSLKDSMTSLYVSYTGGRPSDSQIQNYIINGWNPYTLEVILSKGKKFASSPIHKEFVGNWKNDPNIKDALGGGSLPPELARQAIVNHWDSNTILTKVRALPTYTKSNEFHGNVATMLNVHSSIMGTPDAKAMVAIKDAALAGWSTDQYAAWLRSQPEYSRSPEYQTKALSILSGLGLITGDRPILAKGVAPGPGAVQPSLGKLSPDPRVKGNPTDQNAPSDLGATLSRA